MYRHFELMAPEFKGSPLNGAFTVELGGFIADSPIEYWIYGHSHRNINKVIGQPDAYATSWAMCSVTSIRHSIRKRIFRFKSAIHKSRLSAKVNIRQTDGLLCTKFMVDY